MSPDENVNSVINSMEALANAPDKYLALQNLKTAVYAVHPSALDRVWSILFDSFEGITVDSLDGLAFNVIQNRFLGGSEYILQHSL